ncbi:hypothetical protein DPMN_004369 [Dreissena polymorpha]|uniref:Uncharacterized protein n=1 Tax=Dreissena polymorpha TaxID=45954 RepID=A0A9D4RVJ9_DREPO|nr:hypothetical protein DPMN_004369 [Dreissena polymorpha]
MDTRSDHVVAVMKVFRRKKLVIRLANAGGLAGWLAGWRAGGTSFEFYESRRMTDLRWKRDIGSGHFTMGFT